MVLCSSPCVGARSARAWTLPTTLPELSSRYFIVFSSSVAQDAEHTEVSMSLQIDEEFYLYFGFA